MIGGMTRSPFPRRPSPPAEHGDPAAACRAVLVVGAALITAYYLAPGHPAKYSIYLLVGVASVACIVVSNVRYRPADSLGWSLIAVAGALFVLGDGVLDFDDVVRHISPGIPSLADALYLAAYPVLFWGVFRVGHRGGAAGGRERWADAAMVSLGAFAVCSRFLIDDYLQDPRLHPIGRAVLTAYPLMDLGVLFVLTGTVMAAANWRVADQLLIISVAAMLVGDFLYDLMNLDGTYAVGGPADAAYLLQYVVLGAAAAHPSMAHALPARRSDPVLGLRWVVPVTTAGLVVPVILLITGLRGNSRDVPLLAGLSIALFSLVMLRMFWLFGRLRNKTLELEQSAGSLRAALSKESRMESEMMYRSLHDSLTGLPNRVLLHDRIDHSLAVRRMPTTVALCVCGLDDFTAINDAFGHDFGDQLLVLVGRRLTTMVQGRGTVARLGGDEFAILLEAADGRDGAAALAERVVALVRLPMTVSGQQIEVSVSVGVAVSSLHSSTDRLLTEAEAALREAKASGKDTLVVFEQLLRNRATDRRTLINSFPGSLSNGDFFLEYQPQFSLSDSRLVGFEALVRWRHPVLGVIAPDRFITLAEETGFMVPLGRWILEKACSEAAAWPTVGDRSISLSVNVSGRQMQSPKFLADVRAISGRVGLDCSALVLEITETVLMVDPGRTITTLQGLRRLGIRIAVDDFGTGYSSLSYLRQFPVDILKIDKSFIDPLHDPAGEGIAFVETILRLAEDLRLVTIAEGVEVAHQWDTLGRLGCDEAQGFFMSPPVSALEAMTMITRSVTGPAEKDHRGAGARLKA
jgi:diguanylate cyclase (GGDEF)-like protein